MLVESTNFPGRLDTKYLGADYFFRTDNGYRVQVGATEQSLALINRRLWGLGVDVSQSVNSLQQVLHLCCGWGAVTEGLIKHRKWFGFRRDQLLCIDGDAEVIDFHRNKLPDIAIEHSLVEQTLSRYSRAEQVAGFVGFLVPWQVIVAVDGWMTDRDARGIWGIFTTMRKDYGTYPIDACGEIMRRMGSSRNLLWVEDQSSHEWHKHLYILGRDLPTHGKEGDLISYLTRRAEVE